MYEERANSCYTSALWAVNYQGEDNLSVEILETLISGRDHVHPVLLIEPTLFCTHPQ